MKKSGSSPWSPLSPRFSRAAGRVHTKIDGIGVGFVAPLWDADIADRIERVSTEEAAAMAIRLAREEGLFAGMSTGANVIAALRSAEQLGPDATIVTLMCDTGMKYLKNYGVEFDPIGLDRIRL
jgi:cysteine synthase A